MENGYLLLRFREAIRRSWPPEFSFHSTTIFPPTQVKCCLKKLFWATGQTLAKDDFERVAHPNSRFTGDHKDVKIETEGALKFTYSTRNAY